MPIEKRSKVEMTACSLWASEYVPVSLASVSSACVVRALCPCIAGLIAHRPAEQKPGREAIGNVHRRNELSDPRSIPSCLIAVALIAIERLCCDGKETSCWGWIARQAASDTDALIASTGVSDKKPCL